MSCIECYHCKGNELTQERCADNYTLKTCGSSPKGDVFNACFSLNKTFNMPGLGLRYREEKGCVIRTADCNWLRKNIYCKNETGVEKNCYFTCCDVNRCNLGHLTPLSVDPTTPIFVDPTTPEEMTSRFPMDPRTSGPFPSFRASSTELSSTQLSSTQLSQTSTDHKMKTPTHVRSQGCELRLELLLKILVVLSLIVI